MATVATASGSVARELRLFRTLGWAWFAGADPAVLALVPSEVSFVRALGMWVAAMGVVSGFMMAAAAMQWWNTSFAHVIWVWVVWTALYYLVERLILKSFAVSWKWNLSLTPFRVALAVAVAFVVGLPATQLIYSRSINNQLSINTVAQTKRATKNVTSFYGPKIAGAQSQIAAIRAHEDALRSNTIHYSFLAQCEAGERACSQTHEVGCQAFCHRDQQLANQARSELTSIRRQDASEIATLKSNMVSWRADQAKAIAKRTNAIKGDHDFLARQNALGQVEKLNPGVTKYIDGFLVFLISLDVVAIAAKLWHVFSGGAAYEKAAAALRDADAVNVHRVLKHAEVDRNRITLEAEGQMDIDHARVEAETNRRVADHEATWSEWSGASSREPRTERIRSFNLDDVVSKGKGHERRAVPLHRNLMIGGWIATAATVGLAVVVFSYSKLAHSIVGGEFLVPLALAIVIGLAVYTKGFTIAPAWASRAIFGALIGGLALPLIVLGLNL